MIRDGYQEIGTLSTGDRFVYRPYLQADRVAIRNLLDGIPELLANELLASLIEKQIIASEWETDIRDWPDDLCNELTRIVLGIGRDEQEVADEKNLHDGLVLRTRYPWLAKVSCEQCRHWWYSPLNGRTAKREGQALKRIPGTPLLCEGGDCPKGHWSDPVQLSERNELAVRWCETYPATDDPIDARNRRVIRDATARDDKPRPAAQGVLKPARRAISGRRFDGE